jgi:hypothetical protein
MLAALTLKRAAATRWLNLSSRTAATTRCRKSSESAFDIPAARRAGRKLESDYSRFGNPPDSISSDSALIGEEAGIPEGLISIDQREFLRLWPRENRFIYSGYHVSGRFNDPIISFVGAIDLGPKNL